MIASRLLVRRRHVLDTARTLHITAAARRTVRPRGGAAAVRPTFPSSSLSSLSSPAARWRPSVARVAVRLVRIAVELGVIVLRIVVDVPVDRRARLCKAILSFFLSL